MRNAVKSAEFSGATEPQRSGGRGVGGRGGCFLDNLRTATCCLLSSVLCLLSCGGEKPTTLLTDGGPVQSMDSGPKMCTLDCDDGIMCTDDLLNEAACTCGHLPLHARCSLGQICDLKNGCVQAPPCQEKEDCPKPDDPCLVVGCSPATATCTYDPLDRDGDGHSPQVCASVGGDDCDDTPPGNYTNCDVSQPCTPSENDYNCRSCQMGKLSYPGAPELCDYKDNDCNGTVDDNPMIGMPCDSEWDADLCEEGVLECTYDLDGGEYDELHCTDETDSNQEICDGQDNDCDGNVDEGVTFTVYQDSDGDGYGTLATAQEVCTIPNGWATQAGDCDDTNPEVNPGADELCDGVDNNCWGGIDEWWPELDDDCDGNDSDLCVEGIYVCNTAGTDSVCNDTTSSTTEICDNLDNDCDSFVDEGCDNDGDDFCDNAMILAQSGATVCPNGGGDCDDTNFSVHPGAQEICNGVDNNCNGAVDEGTTFTVLQDSDGDGWGNNDTTQEVCTFLNGWVTQAGDCDDTNPEVNPGADELCDGVDNNCIYGIDENWPELGQNCDGNDTDFCVEGVYVCNAAGTDSICNDTTDSTIEICDNLDNDCDGDIDENFPLLNQPCDSDDNDLCVEGTWICSNEGGLSCLEVTPPHLEVCDGLDNDCDEEVDEEIGASQCDQESPTACVTGSWVECNCCDGIDNDSDNATDQDDSDCLELWCATSALNTPLGYSGHTAIWTGSEMIVWGGEDNDYNPVNTGRKYNPTTDTWSTISITGAPAARYFHTAIWTGSEMIVWGGLGDVWGNLALNTGGRYNPTTDTWSPVTLTGAPFARHSHTAVWTGIRMCIWGGDNTYVDLGNGSCYNPGTNSWDSISTTNAPAARSRHTAIWTGSEMIVWGGIGGDNTGGRYNPSNPANNQWSAVSLADAPTSRYSHTAIWTGSEMIVWGGYDSSDNGLNTGARYNPTLNSWTTLSTINATSARGHHTAVWTNSDMIVWGGDDGPETATSEGVRYITATDTWIPTTIANAPLPGQRHTAIWTGSEMIVWDAWWQLGNTYLHTGGRYFPPP